jgi:hypothetical protein
MCLYPISETTLLLQTLSRSVSVSIIQVYAPTSDGSAEKAEQFYSQISDILKELPKQDLTIIMEVFNIKGLTRKYM